MVKVICICGQRLTLGLVSHPEGEECYETECVSCGRSAHLIISYRQK